MKSKTLPMHALLMATVAGVTGFDQSSVDDATFVARLATEGAIPADQLPKVLETIQKQMAEIDGDFAMPTRQYLEQAAAGVQSQMKVYQAMFAGVATEATNSDDPSKLIDPVVAAAQVQQPLANGHDVSHATT